MVWNATIPNDNGWGFKKVVILALEKKSAIGSTTFRFRGCFGVFEAKV